MASIDKIYATKRQRDKFRQQYGLRATTPDDCDPAQVMETLRQQYGFDK